MKLLWKLSIGSTVKLSVTLSENSVSTLLYSTLLTLDYGKWREHSKSWNSYCNSSIIYQGRKEILLHSDFIWTTKPTSYIFYQGRFVAHKAQILWEGHKIWNEMSHFVLRLFSNIKTKLEFFSNFFGLRRISEFYVLCAL